MNFKEVIDELVRWKESQSTKINELDACGTCKCCELVDELYEMKEELYNLRPLLYKCQDCNYKTTRLDNFAWHSQIKEHNLTQKCTDCDKMVDEVVNQRPYGSMPSDRICRECFVGYADAGDEEMSIHHNEWFDQLIKEKN